MLHRIRSVRALVPALLVACAVALAASAGLAAEAPSKLTGVVNVNTATETQLQLLPGIGEARARALIALRKQRGGFKSLGELRDVKGIGEAGLERLRPFVRFEGKTTAQLR